MNLHKGITAEDVARAEDSERSSHGAHIKEMAALKPALALGGTVMAGIHNGAAALVFASPASTAPTGKRPTTWMVRWDLAAVEPSLKGLAQSKRCR